MDGCDQVEELQERLRPMRGFWVALPHTICNDEHKAADVTNEDRCWNGQTRGRCETGSWHSWRLKHVGRVTFTCVCVFCRYLPPVTADGLVNQINNPEMEVDVARPDVKTRQLIMELRVAVNRLKHALNGRDADLIDSECLRAFISVSVCSERNNVKTSSLSEVCTCSLDTCS